MEPDGARTLTVLVRALESSSHAKARALIERGAVLVDDAVVRDPVFRPAAGSALRIVDSKRSAPRVRTETPLRGRGFDGVALDADIIVVNKHSGVLTVPSGDSERREASLVTLVGQALVKTGHHDKQLWVAHRIDRETSGLVVLARSGRAAASLRAQFRGRTPQREYLAWVEGVVEQDRGKLEHRLVKQDGSWRMRVAENGEDGLHSLLRYSVEQRGDSASRIRVALVTGRRNQIRVQLTAAGHPVLGDSDYGVEHADVRRCALHADIVAFEHPADGRRVEFTAPWPRDLRRLDRRLFDGVG